VLLNNMLEMLERLVNIDSGSSDIEGVNKIGNKLSKLYQELGFEVNTYTKEEVGNILAIRHQEATVPKILILAHMDTVFPKGTAKTRPFKIEGDYAYGPGVIDMKASHTLLYFALKNLIDNNNLEYKNIEIILNSDEEIGTQASKSIIEDYSKNKQYCLTLEPARKDGSIVCSRRGSGTYTIEVFGKAAHSGINPQEGINAIEKLSGITLDLQRLTKKYPGVNINVGLIKGGSTVNTVPDYASIEVDVRIDQIKQVEVVDKDIRDIVNNNNINKATTKISGNITRPPMELNTQNQNLANLIVKLGKDLDIEIGAVSTGGGSDASFTSAMGIPTVDGLGPVGGNQHSEQEYLEINSLLVRKKLLEKVLITLSQDPLNKQ
jgi:glutamate carboxypeptidase